MLYTSIFLFLLQLLLKWGEHASDVQLILQRSALEPKNAKSAQPLVHQRVPQNADTPVGNSTLSPTANSNKDLKKSLTFSGAHSPDHHQQQHISTEVGVTPDFTTPPFTSQPLYGDEMINSHPHPASHYPNSAPVTEVPPSAFIPQNQQPHSTRPTRGVLRPPVPPPYELVRGNPPPPHSSNQRRPLSPTYSGGSSPREFYRHPIPVGGSRPPRELPPPYRDPPPPPLPSHPVLVKMASKGSMKPIPPPSDRLSGVQQKPDDRNRFKNDSHTAMLENKVSL